MKYYHIYLLCAMALTFSCTQSTDTSETTTETEQIADSPSPEEPADQELTIVNKPSLWTVEFENQSNREKLKKPEGTNIETLAPADLISLLNQNYEGIQLRFLKISNDTLFAEIPESDRFTQQLGSTGAYNYMASVVYNLTELPNVKYVKLDFEMGDHAEPGVYTRDDFQTLR